MKRYSFNPADYCFVWTEDWYAWDPTEARRAAIKARNDMARILKEEGHRVRKSSTPEQLITRGGIGSGHPHIDMIVTVFHVIELD